MKKKKKPIVVHKTTLLIKSKFTPNRVKIQRIINFYMKKMLFFIKTMFLMKNY